MALPRTAELAFEKHTLDLGASETCTVADFNGDGKPDILSGEAWYEGPRWVKHPFRQIDYTNNYVDVLSDLALDVDGDGNMDVVSSTWFAKRLWWCRNPGKKGGAWTETTVESGFPVEFAFLVDLDNDGKAHEILPQFGDAKAPLAWYEAKGGTLVKHVVSPKSYGHGIGAGDVNGDGRTDIITPKGWFEAPADPRRGDWTFHAEFDLGGTSFIYTQDMNEDGKPDLVYSMAHDYGIFWLEQKPDHTWTKNLIDDSWSQGHAITLVDLNGDGRKDLLTGKRYMAHNGHDPGEREPLGIYWYEFRKDPQHNNQVQAVRHVIDYSTRTGGGMQIPVADLDGDGDLDFAVGGKSGVYLFENRTRK